MFVRQIVLLLVVCCLPALLLANPDGGDIPPLPGPGLSYGGIPYGSMSGNVAEFFRRQSPSNGRRGHLVQYTNPADVDFAPIEQWL